MTRLRIGNIGDLERVRKERIEASKRFRARVLVCITGCRSKGALDVLAAFREKLAACGMADDIAAVGVGCHGQCSLAPAVLVEPWEFLYGGVAAKDVDEIIDTTIRRGEPVKRLCQKRSGNPVPRMSESPFYSGQRREVLCACGRIDPTSIEDAIASGCYAAAAKALTGLSPEQVMAEVRESGIRGRGGAGFPAGVKWEFCRKARGEPKYLVCNADEGDPGAFMDRALLEGAPHQILEGMLIAAYAIGASHGFVYVRAEYPIAVEHVTLAIRRAREYGLLGKNILGSGFDFDVEVRMGAGAFVCGEETALIASLEGMRGTPRPRPPFPAVSGYLGKPTTINNVETLANLPLIIERGKDWYKSIGTPGNTGTKIFALAGKVNNTGLAEVPLGTTLRKVVFDIGGGVPGGRAFKAAQTGGPSGGCIPAQFLDMPLDYDSLKKIGAIMGSGGLIVMDSDTCMVDIARFFLNFTQNESCGKCAPCRIGTRHMLDMLERICSGGGRDEDLENLERLGNDIKASSLCGLGQTAPNPVLTTIRYFRHEYEAHIRDKTCPAGVCPMPVRFRPEAAKERTPAERRKMRLEADFYRCTGCRSCELACAVAHSRSKEISAAMREDPPPKARIYIAVAGGVNAPSVCRHCGNAPCIAACPTGAIKRSGPEEPVLLEEPLCIGCGACITICPFGVIARDSAGRHAIKCDLCVELLAQGKDPACVSACQTGALRFLALEDMAEEKRKRSVADKASSDTPSASGGKGKPA